MKAGSHSLSQELVSRGISGPDTFHNEVLIANLKTYSFGKVSAQACRLP